ncbi:zinc-binding dehydrogenase [Pseudomonadota bacterium]
MLIHAGVGHVAIQLAKIKGAEVAVTVSTPEKAAFARSLGADHIIMYKDESFVDSINAWTHDKGVDIILDTVGGDLIEQSFAATKVYGDVVTILGTPTNINFGVARKRNIRFTQELMLTPTMMELEEAKFHQGEILKQAAELFQQGKLTVKIAATFPLSQAKEVHNALEENHPMGKVVLTI